MREEKISPKYFWLDEGLKILEEEGPGALSIDNLATRTGKTKGSFYHHFRNREIYIDELLNHYGELTDVKLDAGSGADQLAKLTDEVFSISSRLELVIRAWALYDPNVRSFQEKIDRKRLEYIKSIYLISGNDDSRAELKACRNYSIYIGLQQLKHLYDNETFRDLVKGIFISRSLQTKP